MIKSFLIGEVINELLTSNEELKEILGIKVYPLVASEGSTFPFIVYKRLGVSSNGTKDGYHEDTVEFQITILSETYSQSIDIAQLVRGILERETIKTDTLELTDCHVMSASEEYQDNTYIQQINFITKVN